MNNISKHIDQFIADFKDMNTIWVVELDNGESVYQDDERPGISPASAWQRLKQYVADNSLSIVRMKLVFRSHEEEIEPADGYFYCKAAAIIMGNPPMFQFVTGRLVNDKVEITNWRVPELIPVYHSSRSIADAETSLIVNYGKKTNRSESVSI